MTLKDLHLYLQGAIKALVLPGTQSNLGWLNGLELVCDKNLSILENGKPTGYKNYVRNLTRAGSYDGGQVMKSGTRSLTIGSPLTPRAYAEWEVSCRYGTTPWSPIGEDLGKYIGDIAVEFTKAETLQHVRIMANLFESSGYIITDPYYMRANSGFEKPGNPEHLRHRHGGGDHGDVGRPGRPRDRGRAGLRARTKQRVDFKWPPLQSVFRGLP